MDKTQINFLGSQTEKRIVLSRKLRLVVKILFWVIGVEIVISSALIGGRLWLNKSVIEYENRNEKIEAEIDQFRDIESMLFVIQSRSKMIGSLLGQDKVKVSTILTLENNLMSNGFQPKGDFAIGSSDSLQIEGTVSDVYALDRIKEMMEGYKNEGYFERYSVESVRRITGGQYQLTIFLYLTNSAT